MKQKLAVMLVALLCGCSVFQGGSQVVTPERVQAIVKFAAASTAIVMLNKDPATRLDLTAARDGFATMAEAEVWDIQTAVYVAMNHGLTALASAEGSIVVSGGVLLIDLFTGKQVNLKNEEYVRAFVIGARDGLTDALAVVTGKRAGTSISILERLQAEAVKTRPSNTK